MPRGTTSDIGTSRIAPNGYQYVKVEEGWILVQRLVAEEKLGRKLRSDEYVTFSDGDKTNLEPDNIIVCLRGRTSLQRKLALVQARLDELTALRDELVKRLEVIENL
jgi:hypothetical protein